MTNSVRIRRGIPFTVWRYIAVQYTTIFTGVLLALLSLIYVFEVVELLRRSSSKTATLMDVLVMSFFKLPEVGMRIFPFAILFAGLICFWRLARSHELIVLRASGISAWEFALPAMFAAFLIAILKITMLNPAGAFIFSRYQSWDQRVLSNKNNTIAFTDSGLWLRQINDDNTQSVLHASAINNVDWTMKNVMVLMFNHDGTFLRRIDSPTGKLIPGQRWEIQNATLAQENTQPQHLDNFSLATHLTPGKIEEQYARPDAVSFWAMPKLIATIKHTGLAVTALELYYNSLLAEPLLFMGVVLLAVAFALRHQRAGGIMRLIIIGLGVGFALFFLRDFMRALANADIVPIPLAAWTPALLAVMIGASILLYFEDG